MGLSSRSLARWMRKICSRPVRSGRSMLICLSNLHASACVRAVLGQDARVQMALPQQTPTEQLALAAAAVCCSD